MKPKQLIITLGVIAGLVILGTFSSAVAAPKKCNRNCLVNVMHQYLAAMVKHDPKAVPFADKVKFTENAAEMPVGKGLWETASGGPTEFQMYAADPVVQSVACLLIMKEKGKDRSALGYLPTSPKLIPAVWLSLTCKRAWLWDFQCSSMTAA